MSGRRVLFRHDESDDYFEVYGDKAIEAAWRANDGLLGNVTGIEPHEKEYRARKMQTPSPTPPVVDRRTVVDGQIRRLSVSQVSIFDPNQYAGCNRRWWFRYVAGIKEPETAAQQKGTDIHAGIKHYLKTGEDVLPMIVRVGKHIIPEPGPDLLVEHEFTIENRLLVADGVPFVGAIDLAHRRGTYLNDQGILRDDPPRTAEVEDWKSSADVAQYAKRGDQLIDTVQMVGYGVVISELWPEIEMVRLSHGYFQTRGKRYSEKRTALFPLETVKDKWQDVHSTVRAMKDVAREKDGMKVAPSWEACNAYRGCPHRERCPRSPEQAIVDLFGKGNAMSLLARRNTTPAAGTLAREGVGPAANAAVDAEVARLKAQEATLHAAQSAPAVVSFGVFCPHCGTPLDSSNASRLQDQTVKHLRCPKAPAAVAPADAPASTPALASKPVPPESMATLPPQVQAAAQAQHMTAPVAVTATSSAPVAAPAEAPKTRTPRRRAAVTTEATTAPAAAPPAQVATAASSPSPLDKAESAEDPGEFHLLVDVIGHGMGEISCLMKDYLAPLAADICKVENAADLRCAPADSALGFGKWEGAFAAAMKASPPPAGVWRLDHIHESRLKCVAIEVLQPMAATFIRGVR